MKKIYLSEAISPVARKRLENKYQIIENFDHPEELDGIITRNKKIDRDIISRASNCRVISNHGTGKDHIDLKAAEKKNIPVESAPGLNARSVAELTLGFFLALTYKMKFINQGMMDGKFSQVGTSELQGNELYKKRVGILGSGYVAKELSRMLKNSFDAEIYCWNPHRTKEELSALGFEKIESLEKLFAECDFISVNIPLKPETKNLISEKILEQANPNLILVNTARGGIINEDALYNALISGKIKAAACDVFVQEPPQKNHPLLSLPNFIGTLHVGGSTHEALERVGNKTVDNIEKFCE